MGMLSTVHNSTDKLNNSLPGLAGNAGIVGAGGAGFPTHVKLNCTVDTVIANGAECEPLLHSDKTVMKLYADTVIRGLLLVMDATGASRGYIGVKKKEQDASAAMSRAAESDGRIRMLELESYYPTGDEQVLVYDATGKMVPEGGLPLDVGCLVENVETLFNIAEAVDRELPVTRRFLTVTGAVKRPAVVRAHIGTAICEVMELCGGSMTDDPVVIVGGPMMGTVERDLLSPVTKTTSGLIVLPRDHDLVQRKTLPLETIIKQAKAVCCQCTYCTELCSRNLIGHRLYPHRIMRQISFGLDAPEEIIQSALLCSECGLCEVYACVMGLSPARVNKAIKERLAEAGFKPDFSERQMLSGNVNAGTGQHPRKARELRDLRKIPVSRIVSRVDLSAYDVKPVGDVLETGPSRVELLLKQHLGSPADLIVRTGTRVDAGDVVGEIPEGKLGARVHASISGEVTIADDCRVIIQKV